MERLIQLLAQFMAVIVVISFHEFAHAFVAYKCGDSTAKNSGRMTLNPIKHFDPFGILMFTLCGFGWAKPVPVNPYNFREYRKGSLWTSAAGVITNYCMAVLFYPLFVAMALYVYPKMDNVNAANFVVVLFNALFVCSLSFCVFNLLPFYPLDGFRIVDALDKKHGKVYWFLKKYGSYILLGLVLLGFIADKIPRLEDLDILGRVLNFLVRLIGKPIVALWNWIFGLFGVYVPFVM